MTEINKVEHKKISDFKYINKIYKYHTQKHHLTKKNINIIKLNALFIILCKKHIPQYTNTSIFDNIHFLYNEYLHDYFLKNKNYYYILNNFYSCVYNIEYKCTLKFFNNDFYSTKYKYTYTEIVNCEKNNYNLKFNYLTSENDLLQKKTFCIF